MSFLRAFRRDQSGITSTEYAMLTAVVAVGVILAVGQLSSATTGTLDHVTDCLAGAIPTSSC